MQEFKVHHKQTKYASAANPIADTIAGYDSTAYGSNYSTFYDDMLGEASLRVHDKCSSYNSAANVLAQQAEKPQNFNRLNDSFIKFLLGVVSQSEPLTLSLINDIVETDVGIALTVPKGLSLSHPHFTSVKLINTEQPAYSHEEKHSVLDIVGIMDNGTLVDIEVQVEADSSFSHRTTYYAASLLRDQGKRGVAYTAIRPVISINILNWVKRPSTERYISMAAFSYVDEHELEDNLIIKYDIELPKAKLSDYRKLRRSDAWIAYFNGHTSETVWKEMIALEPALEEAKRREELFWSDFERRLAYFREEEGKRLYQYRMQQAKQEAMQQGHEEGRAEGIQQGIQENSSHIGKLMLSKGYPKEEISELTGLSLEEIEQLAHQE